MLMNPLVFSFLAMAILVATPITAAPVSWYHEIHPIFKRSCNGCHNPNKLKGEVDTSTYVGLLKRGKHGPNFVVGNPAESLLLAQVSGKEPEMPKEGDLLSEAEVSLLTRWIQEGVVDDTPADAYSTKLKELPVYHARPVISALTLSGDGQWLALSGYHEVFLFDTATLELKARWLGESPRIESLAFSPDSTKLAVSAGAPARFGEVQLWAVSDVKSNAQPVVAWKVGTDSAFGISWSPDASKLAFGGADKSTHILEVSTGHELVKFDNHGDWVLRTAWVNDGKRLLSGSRDRAIKLIDVRNGQFIDDINKLLEPIVSLARHPKEEWAAYGGAEGGLRLYRAKENQERTAGNNDVNLVREFERQPGPVHAVAWHPDGSLLAAAGVGGEVRIYQTSDGSRKQRLSGHDGAIYALAFSPDGTSLYIGGFDGLVRVYDPATGSLRAIFTPVIVEPLMTTTRRGNTSPAGG